MTPKKLQRLKRAVATDLSYNEEAKNEFHLAGKAVLREIATALHLTPNQVEIRSNWGGIAVGGEVILHADGLYISLAQSGNMFGQGDQFMFRGCCGLKDHKGLANEWMTYEILASRPEHAIKLFQAALTRGRAQAA